MFNVLQGLAVFQDKEATQDLKLEFRGHTVGKLEV